MTRPSADELNRQGVALYAAGDYEGARLHYVAALQVDPRLMAPVVNLGTVLLHLGKVEAAITLLRRYLNVVKSDGNAWNNLGNGLTRLGKYEEADEALTTAFQLNPNDFGILHNMGLSAVRQRRFDLALKCLNKIVEAGMASTQVFADRAHVYLGAGNLRLALVDYENRWSNLPKLSPWTLGVPEWKGDPLDGKHLLVHVEQGHGDSLMMYRFIPILINQGIRVSIAAYKSEIRLLEFQDWGQENIFDVHAMTPADAKGIDFHSPLASVMRWMGLNGPININPAPYLKAPPLTTPAVNPNSFNVGIVWASGIRGDSTDERRRHAPILEFAKLAEHPQVQLYSLQKDSSASEIGERSLDGLILDPTAQIGDWAEMAAFVEKLDLVVSVCTAAVHLAGAMGKNTWLISQFNNCWRWWDIKAGRTGWPWYDAVSIFQCPNEEDWKTPLAEAKLALFSRLDSAKRVAA